MTKTSIKQLTNIPFDTAGHVATRVFKSAGRHIRFHDNVLVDDGPHSAFPSLSCIQSVMDTSYLDEFRLYRKVRDKLQQAALVVCGCMRD